MKKLTKENIIKIILILLIITICGIFAYITTPKKGFKVNPPQISSKEMYQVINVIDGDTFEAQIGKQIWKVRMLGIDTPETSDPRKPVQCYGVEAASTTKELLGNKKVKLVLDEDREILDKYNRLLAYVYVDQLFINKYLLENGFAREYTYGKAYSFQKEFKATQKVAKRNKKGLWLSCL